MRFFILTLSLLFSLPCFAVDFECVRSGGAYRPKSLNGYPYALGAGTSSLAECETALKYSRNGVICAPTGLGWKPAVGYKNPTRPHGHSYVGGSSMQDQSGFLACLKSTLNSSPTGVCYFGNDWRAYNGKRNWAIGTVNGTFKSRGFPLYDLGKCLERLHGADYVPLELED